MKIADMPSGPEMDRLVAEKVMGWRILQENDDWHYVDRSGSSRAKSWSPSTDIAEAWEVVERMDTMTLRILPSGSYACVQLRDGVIYQGLGDTAPLAICRAALIAVGFEVVP